MTITGGTALSKDEVSRMVEDAEKFAAEDHERREAAEARNAADQLAYQVEKFVTDNAEAIPEDAKAELTAVNDELKELLKDETPDTEKLKAATDATMAVYQKVGQAMNEQAQQQAQAQQAAPADGGAAGPADDDAGSDDDVVEGEIVDEGEAS